MNDKTDKARPLFERIAIMVGRGAFPDLMGRGGKPLVGTEDVIAALGAIQREEGQLVPMAMETFVCQTLIHEDTLSRAWETARGTPISLHERAIARFGSAFAIRKLAGQKYTTTEMGNYARLLACDRSKIERATTEAESWFNDKLHTGLTKFREQLRESA